MLSSKLVFMEDVKKYICTLHGDKIFIPNILVSEITDCSAEQSAPGNKISSYRSGDKEMRATIAETITVSR